MLTLVCQNCSSAFLIDTSDVEPREFRFLIGEQCDWWPDKYPCAVCSAKAEAADAIDPAALATLTKHYLTAREAYSAFHGLGLPEERDCGPTAVSTVMVGTCVKEVVVELVKGSNRSVLRRIIMEDGTTLHLASSALGALVYRISRPRSYVEEALRESD